jgi:7-carboxy-7-deazaguanine synthase
MESVRLIENFVSWQGEGPDSGRRMIILRFKTCNLNCHWCDTQVKMRISSEAPYSLKDIQQNINDYNAGIMVTGGEPTVPRHYDEALALLNELDYPIANVESNGFNLVNFILASPKSKLIHFMFSPKIFERKDVINAEILTESLLDFDNVYFKIVYDGEPSYVQDYCEWLSEKINGRKWSHRVWLMPEGATRADLIRNASIVFDAAERYNFNFSSRNHLIYGFI